MFCHSCSHENPPEARFCGKCGVSLTVSAPPENPTTPKNIHDTPPSPGSHPKVGDAMKIGVLVGSLFLPILGIILGIIFMNDANPEKKAVGKTWLMAGLVMSVIWCILSVMSGTLENW